MAHGVYRLTECIYVHNVDCKLLSLCEFIIKHIGLVTVFSIILMSLLIPHAGAL